MAFQNADGIHVTGVVTASGTGTYLGSALTQHYTLIGGANNTIVGVAVGTANQVLTSNGSGMPPSYQTVSGSYIVGPGTTINNRAFQYANTTGLLAATSVVQYSDTTKFVTLPSQCFFNPAATVQNSKTGDGTVYTPTFTQSGLNIGSNFDGTSTFTAPVTGIYNFVFLVSLSGLSSSFTSGIFKLVTSSTTYPFLQVNPGELFASQYTSSYSVLANMTSGDTATCTYQVSGSTKSIGVIAGSQFSAELIC